MTTWLRYVITFIVFGHGFTYMRIAAVLPSPIKAWRGSSWLRSSVVTNDRLDTLVVSLHVIAGIAILASSVAMAFAPAFPGWWCPLALVGAGAGIVAFAVFWDGQTQFLFKEGITGAIVSSALLVSALLFPRAFGD